MEEIARAKTEADELARQKAAIEHEKQEMAREKQEMERQKALDAEREQLAAERRKFEAERQQLVMAKRPAQTTTGETARDIHLTELIRHTCTWAWAPETRGSDAAYFGFTDGVRYWDPQSDANGNRALPVRSGK